MKLKLKLKHTVENEAEAYCREAHRPSTLVQHPLPVHGTATSTEAASRIGMARKAMEIQNRDERRLLQDSHYALRQNPVSSSLLRNENYCVDLDESGHDISSKLLPSFSSSHPLPFPIPKRKRSRRRSRKWDPFANSNRDVAVDRSVKRSMSQPNSYPFMPTGLLTSSSSSSPHNSDSRCLPMGDGVEATPSASTSYSAYGEMNPFSSQPRMDDAVFHSSDDGAIMSEQEAAITLMLMELGMKGPYQPSFDNHPESIHLTSMDHETPQRKDVDAKAGKDVKNKASSLPEFSPITDSMQINEARELGDFDDQGLHERRANGESTDDASSPSVNGDEVMSEDEAVIAFVLLTNGMKGPEELSSVYVPKVKEMNNVEVISLPQYDPTKNSMQNKRRKVCINSNSKFPPPSLGEEPSHLIINLKTCPQLLDKVSSSSSISKLSFATPVKLKAPLKLFGKHIFSTEEMSRDKKPMHVCRICSKNFLSSQALGGHMSHHTRKSNAVGGKLIPATIEREVIDAHSTVVTDVNEPIRVTEINNHCMKEIDVRHGTRNTNIPDGFLHQSSARVGEATDSPQSFDETCKEILPALNNSRLQLDIDLNMPPKMDDDDADENTDPF